MPRVRLADSTNEMVLHNYTTNCAGPCRVEDGMFFIENENPISPYTVTHRTSLVKSWSIHFNLLTVNTLNSTYWYEILEGDDEAFKSMFIDLDYESIDAIEKERLVKYRTYLAQSINGWLGKIVLPAPMAWDEATAYIKEMLIPIESVGGSEFAIRLLRGIDK